MEIKYQNASLGFRYTTPKGMHDKTEQFRKDLEGYARAAHASSTLTPLIAMSTGSDDTAPSWGSVTIETYPRPAVHDADDVDAETKMSSWVVHHEGAPVPPRMITISGQTFAVSLFAHQEGSIRKGAVVWTTIRKGKLLSFAFAANSPEALQKLAQSMKTVQFF